MPFDVISSRYEDVRNILELLYFGSGIVVAIAALVALLQLRLAGKTLTAAREQLEQAKRDLQVRSRREAIALAAERCEKYAEHIIPRRNANAEKLRVAGAQLTTWILCDTNFDDSSLEHPQLAAQWLAKVSASHETLVMVSAIANDLEAFAIYFARGAADEETAYPVLGALFCEEVSALSPYLINARQKRVPGLTSGPFQNTVELYSVWHLRARQKELEAEANKINLQLTGIDVKKIPPIGVE